MAEPLVCAKCGVEVGAGQAFSTHLRGAGSGYEAKKVPPSHVFCSEACAMRSVREAVARPRCRCCGKPTAAAAPGRHEQFCSKKCEDTAAAGLKRAKKALSKNKLPTGLDALGQQLVDLSSLAQAWADPKNPEKPPAPGAVAGLNRLLDATRARLELAHREREQEGQANAHRRRQEAAQRRAAAQRERDREWREQLA